MDLVELKARHDKYKNKSQTELMTMRNKTLFTIQNDLRKKWLPDKYVPVGKKTKEDGTPLSHK